MGNVLKSRRRLPSAVSLFVLGPQMGRKLKMNDRRAGTEELPLQKRESLSGSHSQWERLSLHKKGKKKWIVPNRREAEHSRAQGNKEGKTVFLQLQHPVRTHKDTVSFVSFQCEMKHSDILPVYCFHTLQQNLNEIC